jgi:hypothetical protein
MPKLTLDLNELQVSSFVTDSDDSAQTAALTIDSFGCTTTLRTHTTSD